MKPLVFSLISTLFLAGIVFWKIESHKNNLLGALDSEVPRLQVQPAVEPGQQPPKLTKPDPEPDEIERPVTRLSPEQVLSNWSSLEISQPISFANFEGLDSLSVEELKGILKTLDVETDDYETFKLHALNRLAAEGVDLLADFKLGDELSIWSAIAATDPDRAMSLAEASLAKKELTPTKLGGLLSTLSAMHPDHAITLCRSILGAIDLDSYLRPVLFSLKNAMVPLTKHDNAWHKLAEAASQETDARISANMFSMLLDMHLEVPMEELAPHLQLPDPWPEKVDHPAVKIFSHFAKEEGIDLEKWINWVWDTVPDSSRPKAAGKIVKTWSQNGTESAGTWLASLGDSSEWDDARMSYADVIRHDDPEAALAWASQVSPGKSQAKLSRDIYRQWREENEVAADNWLENSMALSGFRNVN
jgi:hypothetical protein